MALADVRAQPQGPVQPGTKWTEEQLRQAVELARVGRKLTPKSWPNNARVAVCLSFDTDTEAPLLRDGTTSADHACRPPTSAPRAARRAS